MTDSDKQAIDVLSQDNYKFNIDLIDPLTTGLGHAIDVNEDGVLVDLNGTISWTAKTERRALESAEMIKEEFSQADSFCSHSMIGLEKVAKILNKDLLHKVPCFVAARFSKEKYEIKTDLTFKKLDHSYDEFVWKTYNFTKDCEDGTFYAKDRIDAGVYGAFLQDTCVGFIGTHPEGTMGMLEILPQFRRHGYGEALEKFLANTFMEQDRYPYCHILETNAASLKLQAEMGMWISTEKILWL